MTADRPKARRGTSNGNSAGSSEDRRRRRAWLLDTYQADVNLLIVTEGPMGAWEQSIDLGAKLEDWVMPEELPFARVEKACRCYCCGKLLTIDTLTVDRIIPGCQGGTYRRNNIRPACSTCNEKTGGAVRSAKTRSCGCKGRLHREDCPKRNGGVVPL